MVYKKRKIILILFSIISIILSIGFINKLGLKTIEIEETTIEQGYDGKAFIIQKEEIIYFAGNKTLDLKIEEGTKVALNSNIANTNKVVFNSQDSFNLDIIKWKIENEISQEEGLLNKDLKKMKKKIDHLQSEIKKAKDDNNQDKIKTLENSIKDLESKKNIIEGAFRFAFTDNENLDKIKNQIVNKSTAVEGHITPKKLGILYPSYIYFQRDGLENILHRDVLGNISSKYFSEVENYIVKEKKIANKENDQLLKFVDDTRMYIVMKVPQNSFLAEEEKTKSAKKEIDSQWKENGQNSLYSYLERRRDILRRFPTIKIKWKDTIIAGFLVDSNNEGSNDEKVLTIKLDSKNHKLIGVKQIDMYVYDNKYNGYIIPKESIINKNGKDGVVLLGKANEEIFIEVVIKVELDEVMVLDPNKNEKLKLGSNILAKPR